MNGEQNLIDQAAGRYIYLAQKFRSEDLAGTKFNLFRGPAVYVPGPRVMKINNAVVLSGEWLVTAGGRVFCDAFVQTPLAPLSAYIINFLDEKSVDLLCESPVTVESPSAFLLGGCSNYGHWMFDYLPRLSLYRGDVPLLVNRLAKHQREALSFIGITPAQLIELDYPKAYRLNELHYASTGSSMWTPPLTFQPRIVAWLRKTFEPLILSGRPWRKLFISRAGHADGFSRRLLNGDEIVSIARKHGLEIIENESLSFEEQVRIYSEAAVIAGPIGSGFSNVVFSPKGARIIELIGPHMNQTNQVRVVGFRGLGAILQQEHWRIVGRSDPDTPPEKGYIGHEMYTIDAQEFTRVLQNVG